MSIRSLPPEVCNKIAAGEVIVRPSSALKELIENSLDAHSKTIQITLVDGGLKRLEIIDDGMGIKKEDLRILCMRFTTSKLHTFDDFQHLHTFGFRGEALASISLVAHLTVKTRTNDSTVGYLCKYQDTMPIEEPQPIACNVGTHIIFEDLFYNMPARLRSLRNFNEEYVHCLDVVQKYALQFPCVNFSCKRGGQNTADVFTPGRLTNTTHTLGALPDSTNEENQDTNTMTERRFVVENIFGRALNNELLEWQFSSKFPYTFQILGLISNLEMQRKKSNFIFFINQRLIQCTPLKRGILDVYLNLLPRGIQPWVFLSLELPFDKIDVNVHPTKKEVKFLHQEELIQNLCKDLELRLTTKLDGKRYKLVQSTLSGEEVKLSQDSQHDTVKAAAHPHRVRTDIFQPSIKNFISSQPPPHLDLSQTTDLNAHTPQPTHTHTKEGANCTKQKPLPHNDPYFLASKKLKRLCEIRGSAELSKMVTHSAYVGPVNTHYVLTQFQSKLLLLHLPVLAKERCYQHIINNFGCFNKTNPMDFEDLTVFDLVTSALIYSQFHSYSAKKLVEDLLTHTEFLARYFAIEIKEEKIAFLPDCLSNNYFPGIFPLSLFLLRLCLQVNWEDPLECVEAISRSLAELFGEIGKSEPEEEEDENLLASSYSCNANVRSTFEFVFFPSLHLNKSLLLPKKYATDGTIREITSLEKLYRIFERC